MQITVRANNQEAEITTIDPIGNDAGCVTIEHGAAVLTIIPDEAAKSAGITSIKRAWCTETPQGRRCIKIDCNVRDGAYLTLDNRPDLDALVANRDTINREIETSRNAMFEQQRIVRQQADDELLAAMRAEADELIKLIPADHISVSAKQTGSADGWPIMTYTVDGMEIGWRDLTIHGTADAIRPGAGNAFASIMVASISSTRLAEIEAEQSAKSEAEATAKAAKEAQVDSIFAQARSTGQRQALRSWVTEDCMERLNECSFDAATEWAMPDGTTKITYSHCH